MTAPTLSGFRIIGHFRRYDGPDFSDPLAARPPFAALWFVDDFGRDWYDVARTYASVGHTWFAVDTDGRVRLVESDLSMIVPDDATVVVSDEVIPRAELINHAFDLDTMTLGDFVPGFEGLV